MPWAPHPDAASSTPAFDVIGEVLDPVLVPLGFARGQAGVGGRRGQVIFCRGLDGGAAQGCVDLVLDLEPSPAWRIVDVRYDGWPSDRWHVDFDRDGTLEEQLAGLARRFPHQLTASG